MVRVRISSVKLVPFWARVAATASTSQSFKTPMQPTQPSANHRQRDRSASRSQVSGTRSSKYLRVPQRLCVLLCPQRDSVQNEYLDHDGRVAHSYCGSRIRHRDLPERVTPSCDYLTTSAIPVAHRHCDFHPLASGGVLHRQTPL